MLGKLEGTAEKTGVGIADSEGNILVMEGSQSGILKSEEYILELLQNTMPNGFLN